VGARSGSQGQGLDYWRGGLPTKIHGQSGRSGRLIAVGPHSSPSRRPIRGTIADNGFSSETEPSAIAAHRVVSVIPDKAQRPTRHPLSKIKDLGILSLTG
jgi:hypothetical protein